MMQPCKLSHENGEINAGSRFQVISKLANVVFILMTLRRALPPLSDVSSPFYMTRSRCFSLCIKFYKCLYMYEIYTNETKPFAMEMPFPCHNEAYKKLIFCFGFQRSTAETFYFTCSHYINHDIKFKSKDHGYLI